MGGWISRKVTGTHGVSLWKYIRSSWGTFSRFLTFEVGEGSIVKFWTDNKCGSCCLKEAYPELFRLARNKDALIMDQLQYQNEYMEDYSSFSGGFFRLDSSLGPHSNNQ
jgi:hypothetical protein